MAMPARLNDLGGLVGKIFLFPIGYSGILELGDISTGFTR
jgi:hypothetical protein